MRKTEIFEDVVKITKEDASFCKDIIIDESGYRDKISDDMSDREFLFLMKQYIGEYGVKGHFSFYDTQDDKVVPFRVRRYEDALYVTGAAKDSYVKKGDKITKIDGLTIEQAEQKYKAILCGEEKERQGTGFLTLINFAKEIEVCDVDGNVRIQEVRYGRYNECEEPYVFKKIRDDVAYLKLMDFAGEEQINSLISDNDNEITNSRYLIIDVRKNDGGSNTAYYPIYKYALPAGKQLKDVYHPVTNTEINYSERNVALRLALLEEYEKQELPDETREVLGVLKDELLSNRGKGFVRLPEEEMLPEAVGVQRPEKIIIITDYECGSSGEMFVKEIGALDKVTVIGRPTMGIMDYADVAVIDYDNYSLSYPTSRDLAVDEGTGMKNKGVQVDKYIKWTQEHLVKDVDLIEALNMLGVE